MWCRLYSRCDRLVLHVNAKKHVETDS
jgi:hypothetical protein